MELEPKPLGKDQKQSKFCHTDCNWSEICIDHGINLEW